MKARVTERTLYPVLIKVIEERGGFGISEVKYNSQPDILFRFSDQEWILSVKIGESPQTLKKAFIQYNRHKEESGLKHGLIIFFPEKVRDIEASSKTLNDLIQDENLTCILDTPKLKDDIDRITFQELLNHVREYEQKHRRGTQQTYSLQFATKMLGQHIQELMSTIDLTETELLSLITNKTLLKAVGNSSDEACIFLAAYIVVSQAIFLKLLYSADPTMFGSLRPFTHLRIRNAFKKVLNINYKPIFELDVLDAIDETYLQDTFDLVWGLSIEHLQHDLPGRIFHELMPSHIRKMLAAFYTRPYAADILASLSIQRSDETVLDPACGTGTILTSAYRRKLLLHKEERKPGTPHKRFCEQEIFGADIMPFAVHLASANLSAMNVSQKLERTQVVQADSLSLQPGQTVRAGLRQLPFSLAQNSSSKSEPNYEIGLGQVDTVLMNPPFTKKERGIRHFVNMNKHRSRCGGNIGLWGHFVSLVDEFLKIDGTLGAVLPISLLKGVYSYQVRRILFSEYTPLYILKPTINYAFSEFAEYRDLIVIATKSKPCPNHIVKFALIKKDLTALTEDDIFQICTLLKTQNKVDLDILDIRSYEIRDLMERFDNMMWFCSLSRFEDRDELASFVEQFSPEFSLFPERYFADGFTLRPAGTTKSLVMCRTRNAANTATLLFDKSDNARELQVKTKYGLRLSISKDCVLPAMRTPVGLNTMNVDGRCDYVAIYPYQGMDRVLKHLNCNAQHYQEASFWTNIRKSVMASKTKLMVSRKINPFSPNTNLISFYSSTPVYPSNQLRVVHEDNDTRAKAQCVIFNSILFLANFFLLRQENTGRWSDIAIYDLNQMVLYPSDSKVRTLASLYDEFCSRDFPSIGIQLDQKYERRYKRFKAKQEASDTLVRMDDDILPSNIRIELDTAVCATLGIKIKKEDLQRLYRIILDEMVLVRGLNKN